MAIQNRRGVYSDFTPSKMVPGELAVVQSGDPNNTSGKAVYAAFGASGDVKRLASEDDLSGKVDKVTGKGLSTNDYTTAEKNKLSGIEAQANKTVIDSTLTQTGQAADAKAVGDAIDSVTIETDKTLTEEDVPADAKVVGDELSDIKSDLNYNIGILAGNHDRVIIPFDVAETGAYLKYRDGTISSSSPFAYTDYIDIGKYKTLLYKCVKATSSSASMGMAFYNLSHEYISGKRCKTSQDAFEYDSVLDEVNVPENAVYARFTTIKNTDQYGTFELYGENEVPKELRYTNEKIEQISLISETNYGAITQDTGLFDDRDIYSHTLIPIKAGQNILITAGTVTGGTVIAMLKTNVLVNGQTANFSSDSTWNSAKRIQAKYSLCSTVPSDANYLYVLRSVGVNDRTPEKLIIDGYDVLKTVQKNAKRISDDLIASNAINPYVTNKLKGSIDINSGTWDENSYYHIIIPVSSGQEIKMIGQNSVIAMLKNYYLYDGASVEYSSDESWDSYVRINTGQGFYGTVPADGKYLYVLITVGNTNRTPFLLQIDGVTLIPSIEKTAYSAMTRLRMMSFNVGHFHWGNTDYLTDEECEEYIPKYRQFMCKYAPEIIGLQEYRNLMDENGDYSADSNIFDFVYPYKVQNNSADFAKAIKSKMQYITSRIITFTYSEAGEETLSYTFVSGRYLISRKFVMIVCGHFPWERNGYHMRARSSFLEQLIDYLDGDDYAFIVADFNTGGNNDDVTSLQEAEAIASYLRTVGWESCNGTYLPWIKTFSGTGFDGYLDNIFYKNNGKIVMSDFKVLSDEYENLSSDHYPIYADFILT